MDDFTWLPFFEEMLNVICAKYDKFTLCELCHNIFGKSGGLEDEFSDGSRGPLKEIDPLTFIGYFNRQITDKSRIHFCEIAKNEMTLNSNTPSDFEAIPRLNNMNAWFFTYSKKRNENDIDDVWEFAKALNNLSLNDELFKTVLNIRKVGVPKLTALMFICKPTNFISLDTTNTTFFKGQNISTALRICDEIIKSDEPYLRYEEFLNKIRKHFGTRTFYEISHEAYIYREHNKRKEKAKGGDAESKEQDKIFEGINTMDSEENKELSELQFEEPLEEEIERVDVTAKERSINTSQGDPEVESLYGKWQRGKLAIQPDFQRHFVWDKQKSSRLIESALLDIPLPVIYLAEGKDGKEYVIDGQQRLTAFFSFINGRFPDETNFALTGLKVFTELNRKMFNQLSEEQQDKIRYCQIRTITFKKNSEADLKFEIFERLNTGSVSLNDQELRNCIYRGSYNELLKKLSENGDFKYLCNLTGPDKRMRDVELVLRFAAFYHTTYLNYKPSMRQFLNSDMEIHQSLTDDEATKLTNAFKNTLSIIRSLLDKRAFKRFYRGSVNDPDGYWETKKFNASLYDILMFSFAREEKNIIFQKLDSIREGFIDLMTSDEDFISSIEKSTSSVQAITIRFDKFRLMLQSIIGIRQNEPRFFSFKFKQKLYDQNSSCTICEQKIQHIDDAAVDHIHQYWMGGKTIPENARLAHRYCNCARPRNN